MNCFNGDRTMSSCSDVDIGDEIPNHSPQRPLPYSASTPHGIYQPRVNFHSIESLAISSSNTSSLSFSPLSLKRNDDTGYSSLNSSLLINEQENTQQSVMMVSSKERKARRKLSDWQIWHLRQTFLNNRYPSPYEQEKLAIQLVLPVSSIRIWFQNYRARSGRK